MKHKDQEEKGMCAHASETSHKNHDNPLIVWSVIKLISSALQVPEQ